MNKKSFTLKFTGNAKNKGSMRNDIDVSFKSMNETFKLLPDIFFAVINSHGN